MPGPGGRVFLQAYSCQAVVDHGHQVIIAACATNQASDKQPAVVMIEDNIANLGAVPKEVSADPGYSLAPAVANLQGLGVDPFGAPKKTRHGHKPPPAPRGASPSISPPETGCGASYRPNAHAYPLSANCHCERSVAISSPEQTSLTRRDCHPPEADYAPRNDKVGTRETDQTWSPAIRAAHGHGGASVRPDQAGQRVPAVPAARFGEGAGRVIPDLRQPQPAQDLQVRQLRHQPWPARRPHAMIHHQSSNASFTPNG